MKIFKDGYDFGFDSKICEDCAGNCCIGESGYIWVDKKEIENISEFLKISTAEFYNFYLEKVNYNYSLKEIEYNGGYRCVFFDETKKRCTIYPCRPKQCVSFPFWKHFKNNIKEVEDECPGIIRR